MNDNKISPERLRKVMAQINNMLAKADDPSCTPAEAEQNRERAEVLMARYRLDEAMLSEVDKAMLGIKVQDSTFRVAPVESEFINKYRALVSYVLSHAECEGVLKWEVIDGATWVVAHVFGYESDLMYAERLWNSIRIAFRSRLEPRRDDSLTDGENVYNMRNAGMERGRIGEIMGWGGEGTNGPGRVSRVFKAECKRRAEDGSAVMGRGNNVKQYRKSYAEGFANELWMRLWRMRQAAGADSSAVVLKDRHENVKEAMYTAYPRLRPVPESRQVDSNAKTQANCPKCARAKSGYCRDHAWLRPSRARHEDRTNYTAERRGREAASRVDLGSAGSIER